MFPSHQFDFPPHQRNQMPTAPLRYPSFEHIPPQMRAEPDVSSSSSSSSSYYQSWPCSSNLHGYAYPSQYHGCCEHNHFPGYFGLGGSPYPHPPPAYYHGSFAAPPGAYPVHYISPPHHTMEPPLYEYDKDVHHCCGCPNNSCNRRAGKNVKIEEEGLDDLDKKMDESLVPVNFRNYPNPPLIWYPPNNIKNKGDNRWNEQQCEKLEDGSNGAKIHYAHPMMWFPPNYIMNKEDRQSNEPQYARREDNSSSPYPLFWLPPASLMNKEDGISKEPQYGSSNDSKTREKSGPSERQPNLMNGWYPFDMNNLRSSKRLTDGKQQEKQGNADSGFQCPVFWMPYKPDEREAEEHKRTGAGQESARKEPSLSEVPPVIVPETEESNRRELNGHEGEKLMEKKNIKKIIPVKQAVPEEETKSSVMPLRGSDAGKSTEDGGKRKSHSPPKSSKLPPVCLRVDPLPRKKNSNGSSRSPCPPGDKGKSHRASRENVKPTNSVDAKENSQQEIPSEGIKDKEQPKGKIKTIQVQSSDSVPGTSQYLKTQTNLKPGDALNDMAVNDGDCKSVEGEKAEDKSTHSSRLIDENEVKSKAEEKTDNAAKELERTHLSEDEAARIIQTAYRGYEVRRSEPLKKLKQVMEVRKKVAELKSSIQAFESSSPGIQDVDKWKTVTGETIMNLLLKLDAIQGMHPSIRDIRKSVARELVGLQEKVDYLSQKKAETSSQQASTVLSAENIENGDNLYIKEGQEAEKRDQENSNQSEMDPLNEFNQEMACEDDSTPRTHVVINSEKSDIIEVVKGEGENARESITKALATETEPQYDVFTNFQDLAAEIREEPITEPQSAGTELQKGEGENPREFIAEAHVTETELGKGDPRVDAFTNFQDANIPVLVTNEDENPREPIKEPSSADMELQESVIFPQVGDQMIDPKLENEVSELKALEEFPNREQGEDACMLDGLVQHDLGEVSAPENEKNELPIGVVDENTGMQDNNLVKNYAGENQALTEGRLESEESAELSQGVLDDNAHKLNKGLHVEVEEDGGKEDAEKVDFNAQEATREVLNANQTEPENETVNESLGCAEDDENNTELLKMVDHGSKDAVQALEKETSIKPNAAVVDETEARGEEGTDSASEVFGPAKGKVSENFASENEIPGATISIEPKKVCEEKVSEFSSSKNAPRERDFPVKLDVSSDAFPEGDKKLVEENAQLREMMQKLIEAGQEQITAISNLSARVKDLEKRISKKKKLKVKRKNGISSS